MALMIFPAKFILENPEFQRELISNEFYGGLYGSFNIISISHEEALRALEGLTHGVKVRGPIELSEDWMYKLDDQPECNGIILPAFMDEIILKYVIKAGKDQILMDMITGNGNVIDLIMDAIRPHIKSCWAHPVVNSSEHQGCMVGMSALVNGDYSAISKFVFRESRFMARSDTFALELILE